MIILDTDILSMFAKIEEIELLKMPFQRRSSNGAKSKRRNIHTSNPFLSIDVEISKSFFRP